MAELGQTKDPKALVPGDANTVTSVADALRKKAGVMQGVADDLGNVRIDDWTGSASNAFWEKFTPEKSNWELGHDAMDSVAGALDGHASTLTWAQGQAAEAIELWDKGEQATKQAAADFQAKGGSFAPGSPPVPVGGAFNDPGAGLRQQAKELLDRARNQLKQAGETTAAAIDKQGGKDKGAPSWLSGPADFVGKKGPQKVAIDIKQTESWAEKAKRQQGEGDRFAKYGQWGQEFEKKQGPGVNATLVGGSTEANLFKADAKGATQLGDVTLLGQAEVKVIGAEAGATAGINRDGIYGQAKAGAYLVNASAQGAAQYGIAEVGGSVKGYVGAEADVQASVGTDGVKAGASAFAGARAEAEVHGDVGGIGAGAKAEGWAGAGAEANVTVGQGKDGKWTIGAEAGAAIGLGGKVGFEVTVDPKKIADTVSDAASKLNPFD